MKHDFNRPRRIPMTVAAIAVVLGVVVTQGIAQSLPPSLFKANPQKRDEPVKISSATLEVRDKEKFATFSGDVHVIQGETDLRCSVLVVFYDSELQGKPISPAASGDRSNQQIRRMEARGSVIMTQKEQRAVGDNAVFDVLKNTMLLTGNVVVTRGEDVMRGRSLHVDMTSGIYRMESDGGRVEMLVKSKSGQAQPQTQPSSPSQPRPGRKN